jgi:tetratricopeptide (TPR) repeat protein
MDTWESNDPDTRRRIQEIWSAGLADGPFAAELIALGVEVSASQGVLALNLLLEACAAAARAGDGALICNARIKYAWQLYITGSSFRALIQAMYASVFTAQIGESKLHDSATHVIASVHAHIGNDAEAERLWRELLTSAQLTNDTQLEALATDSIAGLFLARKRFNDALAMKVRTHMLLTALGDARAANVANDIASALKTLQRHSEALQWITRAIETCPPKQLAARALFMLTQAQIMLAGGGDDERARAISMLRNILRSYGSAMPPDAIFESQVRFELGRALFNAAARSEGFTETKRALEVAERSSDAAARAAAHDALQKMYAAIGAFEQALQHSNARAALTEEISEQRRRAIMNILGAQRVISESIQAWRSNPYVHAPPL